jgi:hypothetical protein
MACTCGPNSLSCSSILQTLRHATTVQAVAPWKHNTDSNALPWEHRSNAKVPMGSLLQTYCIHSSDHNWELKAALVQLPHKPRAAGLYSYTSYRKEMC